MFIDDTIYNLNVKTRNIHFLPVYNANDFSNQNLCKNLLINQKSYNPSLYLNLHTDWCWMINFTRLLLAMIQNEFFLVHLSKKLFFSAIKSAGIMSVFSGHSEARNWMCLLSGLCKVSSLPLSLWWWKFYRWCQKRNKMIGRSSKILPGQCPLYNRFFS